MNIEWMAACAQVGEFLYGVYPYEVLMQMYRLKENDKVSKTEIRDFFSENPSVVQVYVQGRLPEFEALGYTEVGYIKPLVPKKGELRDLFVQAAEEGNTFAVIHMDEKEAEYLLKDQADRPFYIPTVNEIEGICRDGWISNKNYEDLAKLIKKYGAEESLPRSIWSEIAAGREFNDIINLVLNLVNVSDEKHEGHAISNFSMDELNGVIRILQECYNSTNLRNNRGWAPRKLVEKSGGIRMPKTVIPMSTLAAKNMKGAESYLNSMGVNVDYDAAFSNMTTIGEHGEVRRVKVGRNDPCPCGSGKKYKKCCGR